MDTQCYCEKSWLEIAKDLDEGVIPDEALIKKCCWKRICQINAKKVKNLCRSDWSALCKRRGHLQTTARSL